MLWQDIVMSAANVVFSISLIPQVLYCQRAKRGLVSLQTSIPTCLALYAVSVSLFSLHLIYSGILSGLTATLWLILALQRLQYGSASTA